MLPVIELEGPPAEQGRTHGRAARARVAHNVERYLERFRLEAGLSADAVRALGRRHADALAARHGDYLAAMRGVAEGAGVELWQVVALNLRYEILYHHFSARARAVADGCTSFAVQPSATEDGHLYLAQNWDWYPEVQGVVLHSADDGLEVLCFSEAGVVGGKIGLNSAGLGLAINGLISSGDDWTRVAAPFHVRCHAILRQRDIGAARRIVEEGARTCSANFLLAQVPDHVVDIETAPAATRALAPEDGLIVHTNHFVDAAALGIDEPVTDSRPFSEHRLARCRSLLGTRRGRLTVDDAFDILRDHDGQPQTLCRHVRGSRPPHLESVTVTSVLMDLHAGRIWISDGQPCANPYQALALTRPPHATALERGAEAVGA